MTENILIKCGHLDCHNMVVVHTFVKNLNKEYQSPFLITVAGGYRSRWSAPIHFCSRECLSYFKKHYMCGQCYEGCNCEEYSHKKLVFKPLMNGSLCTWRGDHVPSCLDQYNIEKRFIKDYNNLSLIKAKYIGLLESVWWYESDCERLTNIINSNNRKISIDMLIDLYYLYHEYELRYRNIVIETIKVDSVLGDYFYFIMNDIFHYSIICDLECLGDMKLFNKTYPNNKITKIRNIYTINVPEETKNDDSMKYIYSENENESEND